MFVNHLSGIVVIPLANNAIVAHVYHGAARQLSHCTPGNTRVRPVHHPGDHKAIALLQRRINGKATVLDVSQQVGEIALDREHPAMFAKGIDKRGIGAINSRQRRRWLGIQRGVVIDEPTDDGRQRAHGSHPGCKQRSEIA